MVRGGGGDTDIRTKELLICRSEKNTIFFSGMIPECNFFFFNFGLYWTEYSMSICYRLFKCYGYVPLVKSSGFTIGK